MDKPLKPKTKFSMGFFVVAFVLLMLLQRLVLGPMTTEQQEVTYDEFRKDLSEGWITEVTIRPERIFYRATAGSSTQTDDRASGEAGGSKPVNTTNDSSAAAETSVKNVVRLNDPDLTQELISSGAEFSATLPEEGGLLTTLFSWIGPMIPLLLIWYFVFNRMGKGAGNILQMRKSKAREIEGGMQDITFADVGGIDEVEVELKELIGFLKTPEKFEKMGAKMPKGVLLVGPPGTGKTLLAKATAGEADVPFFAMSGSDFVEMFVGVGAARTRDLFEQAKAKAPCIIFIDEIDAIGQSRSSGAAVRSNDEREQTLNQLLHEMDGFDANQGVVIMAATNRPEVLDKALTRPGRFDRQIVVPLPSAPGRLQILKIHSQNVPLDSSVDMERLSKITGGFSGAALANMVNEASLMAIRAGRSTVSMEEFDLAIERTVAGLQRDQGLTEDVRRKVAYHEGGHALVAEVLETPDTVHKVSIIPTSKGALGYTLQVPEEDRFLMTERELNERLAVLFGGRAAEMIVFGEPSSGASNDMEKATAIARRMVTELGMNSELGPVRFAQNVGMGSYLGGSSGMREISPETVSVIDKEIHRIIEAAQNHAIELLTHHRVALDVIAAQLIEKEIISGEDVHRIAAESSPTVPTDTTDTGQ